MRQMKNSILSLALLAVTASCSNVSLEVPLQNGAANFYDIEYVASNPATDSVPLRSPSEFYNPILPGWNSDPSVCRVDFDYYLVTSTFAYYPGVAIFHSNDLLNWEPLGYVINDSSSLQMKGQRISEGIYAPSIRYNPTNKTFYVITTDVAGMGNFFVKSTSPQGPWSKPILLPDVHGIDPSFFFDADGRAYIVNNDDAPDNAPEYSGHRTIRARQFDTQSDKIVGPEVILVDKGVSPADKPIWIEGPHIYKIGDTYYLMAAEGGTGDNHSEVLFKAQNPLGPYTPTARNPILTQRDLPSDRLYPVTCAGHADLVQTPDGDWYAFFLGCRPNKDGFENMGRETFLLPVRFDNDSTPFITNPSEQIPLVSEVKGAALKPNNDLNHLRILSSDHRLPDLTLRSSLDYVRNTADLAASDKGTDYVHLVKNTSKTTDFGVPSFAGYRLFQHRFSFKATMKFLPADSTECAGLILIKDESRQYQLCKTINATGVQVLQVRRTAPSCLAGEVLAEVECQDDETVLSIDSPDGLSFNFSYDGKNLIEGVDASYLSTSKCGGFTGTTIGFFYNAF